MTKHRWNFARVGGFDQVVLATADDLRALPQLDLQLWCALACPTTGLAFDARTLALLDTDNDGRVRVPEVLAAVKLVCDALRDPAAIFAGRDGVAIADLDGGSDVGKSLIAASKQVLAALQRPETDRVLVADVSDRVKLLSQARFNGDGVVTAATAADDADTAALIGEMVASVGGVADRSGSDGVDTTKLVAFFESCAAFDAWMRQVEAADEATLPAGAEGTAAAWAAVAAIADKVDDYFARCRLIAYDERSAAPMQVSADAYVEVGKTVLDAALGAMRTAPLAHPQAGASLPLGDGANPAWSAEIAALRDRAVAPLLGDRAALTSEEWATLRAKVAAYSALTGGKAGAEVEGLGVERVRALLGSDLRGRVEALIAEDEARRPEVESFELVERLVRYHRDLASLLENFVHFGAFYDPSRAAIFQAGALYLDQRRCDLVLPVADAGRHGTLAGHAGAFMVYVDCARRSDGAKASFCAAVTDGDAGALIVGRNGLFVDRDGKDWDATITKVIVQPISIREAFFSPYVRFVQMVEEQVAKRAAAADAESKAKLEAGAAAAATADSTPVAAKEPPKKIDIGTVAAIGVAVGGISAAIGVVMQALFGLGAFLPLGILGILLLISGPSMAIAALKLRRRSIGPILDANGWAVNAAARLNIPFGRSLTRLAVLPPGARRDLDDPFAEKKRTWPWIVLALALLTVALWMSGTLFAWTDGALGRRLKPETPEAAPAAATAEPAKP